MYQQLLYFNYLLKCQRWEIRHTNNTLSERFRFGHIVRTYIHSVADLIHLADDEGAGFALGVEYRTLIC